MKKAGATVISRHGQRLSPGQFAEFVESDATKWGKLIHDLGIKID